MARKAPFVARKHLATGKDGNAILNAYSADAGHQQSNRTGTVSDEGISARNETAQKGIELELRAKKSRTVNTGCAHLLVIDDNKASRDELVVVLCDHGYHVSTADGGWEALTLIAERRFDLVFLDAEMPEVTGLEVLSRIRERYSQVDLPVIILVECIDDAILALDVGANEYITRPIISAEALARVRNQLSLKSSELAVRELEERYALALAGSRDGIWDWNLDSDEMVFSHRWKSVLGYEDDEIGSHPEEWFDRMHPEDRAQVTGRLKSYIEGHMPFFETEYRILDCTGSYRWMRCRGVAVRDSRGIARRIAGSQTDIKVSKIADPLTGLPDRALFMDRLTQAAERAKRHTGRIFAVLFLDLDRFKLINDSVGHTVGDQFLVEFARRLSAELRSTDGISRVTEQQYLARLGGDEFIILLDELRIAGDAVRVADRLVESLKKPFQIGRHELFVTVSIGVSLSCTGYERPEDLVRDADIAMYRAKAQRSGGVELFDAEMRASAAARLLLETDLHQAMSRSEFCNWYQVIVKLDTGKFSGFEALARWQHPTRGIVEPNDFISVAEETGIIIPLGRQVLKQVCQEITAWRAIQPAQPPLVVSVNLSCRQLMQADLAKEIRKELEAADIDPKFLKLEITESTVMSDPERARNILKELKSLGVQIAMDDFGTGYSSLSYLHSFPIDTLKIDRSFISLIQDDPDKLEIVSSIISLAHNLGLDVTAEGIETPEQMFILRQLGCESAQGFLFSPPLDAAAAANLLVAEPTWNVHNLLTPESQIEALDKFHELRRSSRGRRTVQSRAL